MKKFPEDKIHGFGLIPNILAFAISLTIAYFLKWEVSDLVWSLWLCSLTLGYLTLLSSLVANALIGLNAVKKNDDFKKRRIPVIIAGSAAGLFMLIFFSIHFGAFHAGYSVFLQSFFPLDGMPIDGFGRAFMNPPLLWLMAFQYLIKPYGVFLIPTIIAERDHIFTPLYKTVYELHGRKVETFPSPRGFTDRIFSNNHPLGRAMFQPYINVIRMHLLILFFAFSYALKFDSFLVFATVYFVYFFPWSELRKFFKKKHLEG